MEITFDNTDAHEYAVNFSGRIFIAASTKDEFEKELKALVDEYAI